MPQLKRRYGRKKPYTNEEIKKLPCCRCGKPSSFQWQICSDGNLYRPICIDCDIALNKLVLEFMDFPDRDEKIKEYEKAKRKDNEVK